MRHRRARSLRKPLRDKDVIPKNTWPLAVTAIAIAGLAFAQSPDKTPGNRTRPTKSAAEFPAPPSVLTESAEPINLPAALQLAGVQNPELLLARERVTEADALRQLAAAQLLPSLNAGTNVDTHTGTLQQSNGTILKVNRGALYLGLGAGAVGAGTVSIPGVVWNGNLSETAFGILVSRQVTRQSESAGVAARNDVLLRVATGYVELLRAEGRRAVAVKNRSEAADVARVTANFALAGQGRHADADRAAAELEQRNADVTRAEADVLLASARLCQLLNLDPSTRLTAADGWVVPHPVVPDPVPLCELIAIALARRPELAERRAAIQEALLTLRGAKLLPFSPEVALGFSAGSFGGGSNLVAAGILQPDGTILRQSRFDNYGARTDVDAVVYWTLRNLGVGNAALIRIAESRLRASNFREIEVLDRVRAEVATAHARTHARFAEIQSAERAVEFSRNGFQEDLRRTYNQEGLPIEVLDSMRLLARSRSAYLDAICDYNRAQFELYVALGQPPADTLARPAPSDLVAPPGK
jgi:outer membrane protein TolC